MSLKINSIDMDPGDFFLVRLGGMENSIMIVATNNNEIKVGGPMNKNQKEFLFSKAGVEEVAITPKEKKVVAKIDPGMRILVVDDFSTMRRIVKNLLRQLGYENIEEAEDGAQALARVKNGGIDFIITDWNMPDVDGFELLKRVRSDNELKDLPVLMVITDAEKEKVITAIQAGLNNFIVKPFTGEFLKEKIDKVFEKLAAHK